MAKSPTKTPAADATEPSDNTATVADAKSTAGVNAGSDEVGSLGDVEEAQNDAPTDEPAAAYSSGFDAESVAKEQRAIKRQAEEQAKVNAAREAEAADDEKQAKGALDRIKRLEQRVDEMVGYVVAMSEGRKPMPKETD